MGNVTKKYISEVEEVVMRAARSPELLHEFLRDVLTPAELDEVALRWQIVKRLAAGASHRDIAEELGVGVATIARGARELTNPTGGFWRLLQRPTERS
ncbi:MAG: Trp family transcriptional regulator [Patescibacteria group bacterium]|jgi:TrpR family trp operon transcriptional repressor